MLVLIGPGWLSERLSAPRDWVRLEILAGLRHPAAVVVPLLVNGARMPTADELPETIAGLAGRNAVVLPGDEIASEVDTLLASVERARAAAAARRSSAEVSEARIEEPA